MKLSLIILTILVLFLLPCYAVERKEEKMSNLEKDAQFENWKELWSDGYELHLISLPDFAAEKKIYEVKKGMGLQGEIIGYRVLSSNNTKCAFTAGGLGGKDSSDSLYIIDIKTGDLKKIGYCPPLFRGINLRGFLGNERLLLEGYLSIENDIILSYEKSPDNSHYFYIFNLNTKKIEALSDLGITTVGMANSKCAGDLIAYETSDGSSISAVVYNVNTKKKIKINKPGDLAALSPNGQKILLKSKDDYYLIDVETQNEELILSKNKIKKFIPLSIRLRGGYWELRFWSWSPDGKYILFNESSDQNKGKSFLLDIETEELKSMRNSGDTACNITAFKML